MRLSLGVRGPLTHMYCFLAANGFLLSGHGSIPFEISSRPTVGDPELTEDQINWNVQVGDLDSSSRTLVLQR